MAVRINCRRLFAWLFISSLLFSPPLMRAAATAPEAGAPASGASFTIAWSTGCQTPPVEAVAALEYAAGLWGTWISSTVPIAVSACWTPNLSGGDALATGMPTEYVRNFSAAPLFNTAYPIALANALSGRDLNPARGDMTLQFRSDAAWSYATSRRLLAGEDFIAVALHELAHGLGFTGNMYAEWGVGFCGDTLGLYPCPTPYDQFVVDSDGILLLSYLPDAPYTLADRLTGDANFGGPNALAAYGGALKLYTPATWTWGSSLSHLDQDTFKGSANRLMTPSYSGVTRHPGAATLALFQDLGWRRADGVANLATAGAQVVGVSQAAPFTGTLVWPVYAGQSITYTWTAAEHSPIIHTGAQTADSALLVWDTPGEKRIMLTAVGAGLRVSAVRSALAFTVSASGPTTGKTERFYTFNAVLAPDTVGLPITYTWAATDKTPVVHANRYVTSDAMMFSWSAPGTKTITVAAQIGNAQMQSQHTIELTGVVLDKHIYLPLMVKAF